MGLRIGISTFVDLVHSRGTGITFECGTTHLGDTNYRKNLILPRASKPNGHSMDLFLVVQSYDMAAVHFLQQENLQAWAGVEPAFLDTEGQRQTNYATQPASLKVDCLNKHQTCFVSKGVVEVLKLIGQVCATDGVSDTSQVRMLAILLGCQVIYSQFGLAIHPSDHQARRRFVEWAKNEIAVVPDFHKRILFSDEAHFWLNGYVNKQNCRIWSEANPQVYVETPLHPEKLTVWCALWAGGILLQKR
ncbi:hypothetical protein TNCV_3734741 [Trichonephila clavipes]|nr:hypothetical protein TNCV_3734741 [Trichonephila clavipes]